MADFSTCDYCNSLVDLTGVSGFRVLTCEEGDYLKCETCVDGETAPSFPPGVQCASRTTTHEPERAMITAFYLLVVPAAVVVVIVLNVKYNG